MFKQITYRNVNLRSYKYISTRLRLSFLHLYLGRQLTVKTASAASTYKGPYSAKNLIDNDIDTYYYSEERSKGDLFWIQLELESMVYVDKIELVAIKECCWEKLSHVTIRVGTHSVQSTDSKTEQLSKLRKNEVCNYWEDTATHSEQTITIQCGNDLYPGTRTKEGQFVTIWAEDPQHNFLGLAEARVFGTGLNIKFLQNIYFR